MTEQTDERLGLPSASNWHRYELCAGSFQLEQEARKVNQAAHERSVDAARGERIHAYLAGEKVELSESEQITADFLRERAEGEVKRIFGDQEVKVMREKRLWLRVPR